MLETVAVLAMRFHCTDEEGPAEQHLADVLGFEQRLRQQTVTVVCEVKLALEHGHLAFELVVRHLALVAVEQCLQPLVDLRLHDELVLLVVPHQRALVLTDGGESSRLVFVLAVDQPAKEAVDVVPLNWEGEVAVLQVLCVELSDEVDLTLIGGLGAADNTRVDQGISGRGCRGTNRHSHRAIRLVGRR